MEEPLLKKLKIDFEDGAVTVDVEHTKTSLKKYDVASKNCRIEIMTKQQEISEKQESMLNLIGNSSYSAVNDSCSYQSNKLHCKNMSSPKKKLEYTMKVQNTNKIVFNYGNYSRYYGYRSVKDFQDVRLDVFCRYKNLFEGKDILDIGCNSGLITMNIAENTEKFNIKYIVGLDIDKRLIKKATKLIENKRRNTIGKMEDRSKFPFNIKFVHGNYVLRDNILLEIESEQFDLILCLSVTKWIHLNFGDNGLKQTFKRMFLQIRPGGYLILEPQPWSGYKRRKNLTYEINENYKNIKFLPETFTEYLLGPEIGFCEMKILDIPEHPSKGFRRPLQLFYKK